MPISRARKRRGSSSSPAATTLHDAGDEALIKEQLASSFRSPIVAQEPLMSDTNEDDSDNDDVDTANTKTAAATANKSNDHDDDDDDAETETAPPTLLEEVRALLHTDLSRMPDVMDFIRTHAHNIDSLPRVALMNMRDLSTTFIKRVAHLPAVEAILVDYLMEEDEQWAAYLSEQFKAGVAFVDAFQQGLYNRFPSWTLPEPITRRLASIPAVKAAVISYLTSVESKGTSILRQMVATNVEHMRDLQALVARHLDSLPTLKKLRDAHYEGIPELKHFDFIPNWMADNEFIHTGYRPELLSFKRCWDSLFYLHNETGNIYTHLVGGVFFLVFAIYFTLFSDHAKNFEDKVLFSVFWATATGCLMCSAIFHTCNVHSKCMNSHFSKLDYMGITLLICGSTMAILHFAFKCDPELSYFYMGLTGFFGLLATWGSTSPWFEGPKKKHIRVLFFIALGATSFFPQLHLIQLYGIEHFLVVVDVIWLFGISVPLYLIGSVVFVFKFPERFFPGKFDIWFHSHQLWHIFVILAAYAHYMAMYHMMHYRQNDGGTCEAEKQLLLQQQ